MSSTPKHTHCPQSPPQPTASRRRRTAGDDPDERRQKFLERNRAAATRCRQKRKVWVSSLERKAEELTHTNLQLQVHIHHWFTYLPCNIKYNWHIMIESCVCCFVFIYFLSSLRMRWHHSGQKSLNWSKFFLHIKTVLSLWDREKRRVSMNHFVILSSFLVFGWITLKPVENI